MDLIFFNGKIITMDPKVPQCEAVAIENNKIFQIGSTEEILSLKQPHTLLVDLEGKPMVPGFNDSHMHLLNYGSSLQQVNLVGATSLKALIEKSKDFLSHKPLKEGQWLQGRGWNQDFFAEKRFPTRHDLDQITTAYPVCLARACGHVAIVNSKALEVMEVTRDTPQVEGGHFDLDSNGEPLGIFRENALSFIYDKIPQPTVEDIKEMILAAAAKALEQGITSVQTDDFEAVPGKNFEKVIEAYTSLRKEGKLPIRVYEQCLLPTLERLENFLHLGHFTGEGDSFFKIGPLKLLCDGSLGARTAYLCEAYADDPATHGISVYTQEELDQLVLTAHNRRMQVAIHCIGDKIMYMAFDSIEKAQRQNPQGNIRHSIIHCQITDEILLDKYRDLDVIAHIQPIFLDYDLHIVEDRIGKDRTKTSYNWKSMLDRGVHVACGSDCPVEPFDVLPGIYCAVTRKDLKGYPEGGWLPEQKLTVQEALHGFTLGAAYASFEENIKGSITPGKLGDLVVLSEDIFDIAPDRIKDVEVFMTVVDGKIAYKKS